MSSSSKTPLSLLEDKEKKKKDEKPPRIDIFIGPKCTLVLFDITFQKTFKKHIKGLLKETNWEVVMKEKDA